MDQKTDAPLASKFDSGKAPVELVPPEFIEEIALVLGHGAKKYGRDDWRKGLPWTRIYGSTMRHLLLWARGEDLDRESGMSHLAHAATNVMFLITWSRTRKDLDDRIKE